MSALYNFELAKYLMVPERFYSLFNVLLIALLLIVLLLKGLALWRSARLGQKVWFWVFIFVNTLGILEIVYLIVYRDGFNPEIKREKKEKAKKIKKEEEKKEEAKIEEKVEEKKDENQEKVPEINNWA